jgi:hypothetical protein
MSKGIKSERGLSDVELRPDGWERFTRAVDAAIASGPKPRSTRKLQRDRASPKKNKPKRKDRGGKR